MATSPFPTGSIFGAGAKPSPGKPSENQLKGYAAGVIAHIAIQTRYRVEHPNNFVVNERSIWVGDPSSSTISKFADLLDRGLSLREVLGMRLPQKFADVGYYLLTLLNDSSIERKRKAGRLILRRYDILDFGRLATLTKPTPATLFGEAYEIKSEDPQQRSNGTRYVTKMTTRFNQVISTYGQQLGQMLNVANLATYRLRLGATWPNPERTLQIATNILRYRLASAGVIAYRWEKFEPTSLERMWQLAGNTARLVRDAMKRTPAVRTEVAVAGAMVAVPVVFVAGAVVMGILIALADLAAAVLVAGSRVVLATNRVLAANGVLVFTSIGAAEAFGAPAGRPAQPSDATAVDGARAVYDFLTGPNPIDARLFSSPVEKPKDGERLPGGTAPTEEERWLDALVIRLVAEIRFIYAVSVGQGDEDRLDNEDLVVVDQNLRIVFEELGARVGTRALFDLFGIAGPADEAGILQAAMDLVGLASEKFNDPIQRDFFNALWFLDETERARMIPEDADEDGEARESD